MSLIVSFIHCYLTHEACFGPCHCHSKNKFCALLKNFFLPLMSSEIFKFVHSEALQELSKLQNISNFVTNDNNQSKFSILKIMSWKLIRRISAVAIATLAGAAAHTHFLSSEPKLKLKLNPNYASEISPSNGWDYNWDHRDCKSIEKVSAKQESENHETLKKQPSRAIRNIILIRNGQFIRNCATEPECILTELGRQQAKFTGQRIAEMEFPIENVVVSPLTRAQETGQIIMEQLPHHKDIPIKTEPMIEKGAPFEPGKLCNLLLFPDCNGPSPPFQFLL